MSAAEEAEGAEVRGRMSGRVALTPTIGWWSFVSCTCRMAASSTSWAKSDIRPCEAGGGGIAAQARAGTAGQEGQVGGAGEEERKQADLGSRNLLAPPLVPLIV